MFLVMRFKKIILFFMTHDFLELSLPTLAYRDLVPETYNHCNFCWDFVLYIYIYINTKNTNNNGVGAELIDCQNLCFKIT